jgi:hypothetical protein
LIDRVGEAVDQAGQTFAGWARFARDARWLAWAVIGLGGSYLLARFIVVLRPQNRGKP